MKLQSLQSVEIVPLPKTSVRKDTFWRRLGRQWDLQVMVLPGIILLLIFSYLPMWGVLTAFQDYDLAGGFFASPWVGLKHFQVLLTDPLFLPVLRNTIVISILRLIFAFPAPILPRRRSA